MPRQGRKPASPASGKLSCLMRGGILAFVLSTRNSAVEHGEGRAPARPCWQEKPMKRCGRTGRASLPERTVSVGSCVSHDRNGSGFAITSPVTLTCSTSYEHAIQQRFLQILQLANLLLPRRDQRIERPKIRPDLPLLLHRRRNWI